MIQLPPALERAWHTHGYYGSVSHNVKAIYQRYMGWFDGNFGTAGQVASPVMMSQLTPEQIFDGLAIRVNGPRSWDLDIAVDITFVDTAVNYRLTLHNGVLVHRNAALDPETATVTVRLAGTPRLLAMATGDFNSPGLELSGDREALQAFLAALDAPNPNFNIVTP